MGISCLSESGIPAKILQLDSYVKLMKRLVINVNMEN